MATQSVTVASNTEPSPEPVLLHYAVLGLTLEWMASSTLPVGETPVPDDIEAAAAALALEALEGPGA